MEQKNEVKPLQVRLPSEVYDSLQYVANTKGVTLNSIVIECLKTHLPYTTWTDSALIRDIGFITYSAEQHADHAMENLDLYRQKIQSEIFLLSTLTQLRIDQLQYVTNIGKSLRKGFHVVAPKDKEAEKALSQMETFQAQDYIGHRKTEDKMHDQLKAIARARTEAFIEWDLFNRHLDRLNEALKKNEQSG